MLGNFPAHSREKFAHFNGGTYWLPVGADAVPSGTSDSVAGGPFVISSTSTWPTPVVGGNVTDNPFVGVTAELRVRNV